MDTDNMNLDEASKSDLLAFAKMKMTRDQRISFALVATEAGIWEWDTNEKEIFLSSESYTLLGFDAGDQVIDYSALVMKVHPEDRPILNTIVQEHVNAYPQNYEFEFRVLGKGGQYIWMRSIGKLKNDPSVKQRPVLIGIVDNITRRKKLELKVRDYQQQLESSLSDRTKEIENQNKLLRDRERAYSTLLQNLQGMAYRYDNDGRWTMLYVSDGCRELTGYSVEDLTDTVKMEKDILAKEYVDSVWEHISNALEQKESFKISYPIITADLELKWVLDRGVGVYDDKGTLVFLEGVIIDITEQKNQELKYQLAQETIDNAPIAIQWIKEDGSYHYVNQAAIQYSGYSKKDYTKIKIYDIDPLLSEDDWKWLFKERMTKPAIDIESSYKRKDGSAIPVLVNASNIVFEGVAYNCSYINDISELKIAENKLKEAYNEIATSEEELRQRTEELDTLNNNLVEQTKQLENTINKLKEAQNQLVQAEKMASLGILVAGIAHELNNPINYLSTGGEGLKIIIEDVLKVVNKYNEITPDNISTKLAEISELKEEVDFDELLSDMTKMTTNINMGAEQAAEIIRGLKSFSGTDAGLLSDFDIHKGIDNVLLMLYNTYKHRINVIKNYGDIPQIMCYPAKLGQVFMNLISNAIQAIKGKGEVVITTYLEQNELIIDVKDSGAGIPSEIINRLFEPFFTTKEVGKGTGLGLSISMGIIEDHNGRIEVFNNDDKGATFRVFLPLNQSYNIE